jgi:hypothetical protein
LAIGATFHKFLFLSVSLAIQGITWDATVSDTPPILVLLVEKHSVLNFWGCRANHRKTSSWRDCE